MSGAASTMSEADFEAIVSKNGGPDRVRRVDTVAGTIVLAKPAGPAWRAAYKKASRNLVGEATRAEALEDLFRACLVHPSRGGLDALLDEWPGLPLQCADAVTDLLGITGAKKD